MTHELPEVVGVGGDECGFDAVAVGECSEFIDTATGSFGGVGCGFYFGDVRWSGVVVGDDVNACCEEVVVFEVGFEWGCAEAPEVVVADDACDVGFCGEPCGGLVDAFAVQGFFAGCFFAVPVV